MPKLFGHVSHEAQRALLQRHAQRSTLQVMRQAAIMGVIYAVLFVVLKTVFDAEPTPIVPNFILGFVVLGVGSLVIMLIERKQARTTLERISNGSKTNR